MRTCNVQPSQQWAWNSTDRTLRNKGGDLCLAVVQELEVWADPLSNSSTAVVLLNRGNIGGEAISFKWTDIGLPANQTATVRDLWAHKDLGSFTGDFRVTNVDSHSVVMLKVTPK